MSDIDRELARMKAEGFNFTERPGWYIRKRDGQRIKAADWPDGDVSWRVDLDSMPVIMAHLAGTCSPATFERNHRLEE